MDNSLDSEKYKVSIVIGMLQEIKDAMEELDEQNSPIYIARALHPEHKEEWDNLEDIYDALYSAIITLIPEADVRVEKRDNIEINGKVSDVSSITLTVSF